MKLPFSIPSFSNARTSIAGVLVVVLGAITSSPVGQPFPQHIHDWATFLAFVFAGLGLHSAADAPRPLPVAKVGPVEVAVDAAAVVDSILEDKKKSS